MAQRIGHEVKEDGTPVYLASNGRPILQPQKYKVGRGEFKRSKADQERDRGRIEELYLEGKSHQEIADILSSEREYPVSRAIISNETQALLKYWRERAVTATEQKVALELAKLDNLEKVYWEAWERSLQVQSIIEKTEHDDSEDRSLGEEEKEDGRYRKGKKKREKRGVKTTLLTTVGEPKFLAGVERCILLRLKIFGVGETKTITINWKKQAEDVGLDPGELKQVLIGHFVESGRKELESGEE